MLRLSHQIVCVLVESILKSCNNDRVHINYEATSEKLQNLASIVDQETIDYSLEHQLTRFFPDMSNNPRLIFRHQD